jgi:phosphate transport system substrate-binding protein
MEPPVELVPGSMAGLIEAIAAFDGAGGAIGFSVFYYADLMYSNPDLKLLSVNGIAPSFDSIYHEEYPLVNDFFVVIRADAPQDSPERLLRDWFLTDEGTALLRSANYVPVR